MSGNLQRTAFASVCLFHFRTPAADCFACDAESDWLEAKRPIDGRGLGAKLEKKQQNTMESALADLAQAAGTTRSDSDGKAAAITQNTSIGCAPSQKKSIGCESRFRVNRSAVEALSRSEKLREALEYLEGRSV